MSRLTDAQVVALILEATSCNTEPDADRWAALVNVVAARVWLEACKVADDKSDSHRIAAAMSRRVSARWVARSLEMKAAKKQDPLYLSLSARREKLVRLREIRWAQYRAASDEAFRLSRFLYNAPPKVPREKPLPRRSPAEMAAYWRRKLDYAEYLLGRAEGRLAKLEARQANQAPDPLTQHFHMGMVGGSGKAVRSLNRQRERELSRAIKDAGELKAARERVRMLEVRVERFRGYYRKWEIIEEDVEA